MLISQINFLLGWNKGVQSRNETAENADGLFIVGNGGVQKDKEQELDEGRIELECNWGGQTDWPSGGFKAPTRWRGKEKGVRSNSS